MPIPNYPTALGLSWAKKPSPSTPVATDSLAASSSCRNENENEFKELFHGLQHEHRPSTPTEHLLVEGLAQHYWLAQRALNLQQICFEKPHARI